MDFNGKTLPPKERGIGNLKVEFIPVAGLLYGQWVTPLHDGTWAYRV